MAFSAGLVHSLPPAREAATKLPFLARRCIDMGLKGFVLPDKPENIKVPGYADDWWAPVLELCNETGTPINFHISAAIDPSTVIWEGFSFQKKLTIYPIMHSLVCAATLGKWMVSGLLDRYPKLNDIPADAGRLIAGWIASTFCWQA